MALFAWLGSTARAVSSVPVGATLAGRQMGREPFISVRNPDECRRTAAGMALAFTPDGAVGDAGVRAAAGRLRCPGLVPRLVAPPPRRQLKPIAFGSVA